MPMTELQPIATPPSQSTSDTGFVVLTMSKRILHLNDSARTLLRTLSGEGTALLGRNPAAPLPEILADVFHAVLAELEKRIASEDWRHFEMRRLFPSMQGILLARGFGIPDSTRRQQSRIVIMLQHEIL